MYSQHNGSAILHSVLSLSSPTLLHAIFGVKNPLLITAEFYCQYAYIGTLSHWLFWHQVAFPVWFFFFFLVCAVFFFVCFFYRFSENQWGDLSAPAVAECDLNLLTAPKDASQLNSAAAAALCRFSGHQQTRRGKRQSSSEPGPRVSGRREQRRIGSPSEAPLHRSEEQSGDQSGLFYAAGAILWSPRVTYSTHFIKFTSVLIADQ